MESLLNKRPRSKSINRVAIVKNKRDIKLDAKLDLKKTRWSTSDFSKIQKAIHKYSSLERKLFYNKLTEFMGGNKTK